jgi:N-methylhydantoinase A
MADAIRVMTVERGLDPRGFVLLAAGGAAPLHAGELARALGIGHVIVPRAASVYCALGMLGADLTLDGTAPVAGQLEPFDRTDLQAAIDRIAGEHADHLARLDVTGDRVEHRATLDARYAGRHRELPLPLPSGRLHPADGPVLRQAFDGAAQRRFGHADQRAAVEYLSVRVTTTARADSLTLPDLPSAEGPPSPRARRRVVFVADTTCDVPVYEGDALRAGQVVEGPAVIEDPGTTTLLWPGDRLVVDRSGGYRIDVGWGSDRG